MKILISIFSFCLFALSIQAQKTMSLIEIQQPQHESLDSFDLSGLETNTDGSILLISDKPSEIYQLDKMDIKAYRSLEADGSERYDLEGIDRCGKNIFVACESGHNTPYLVKDDGSMQKIEISYPNGITTEEWGNAGLEGIAMNCEKNIMYLAKERGPKHIYEIQLNEEQTSGKVIREIKLEEDPKKGDISDLKYLEKDGEAFLYVLQRKDRAILRINLKDGSTETRSYAPYLTNSEGLQNLYTVAPEKAKYGMAEALLIRDKEIWVGLDNNSKAINEKHELAAKYQLKGKMPVILRLERGDF